jgi:hypothetical protein
MEKIYISKNGFICSPLSHDITLGNLIDIIKNEYPLLEHDEIKILRNGIVLIDNDKKLTDLGVSVNKDVLRIIPVSLWSKLYK